MPRVHDCMESYVLGVSSRAQRLGCALGMRCSRGLSKRDQGQLLRVKHFSPPPRPG